MNVSQDPIVVLHVDDDPQMRALVSDYFEKTHDGFTVRTGASPADALDALDHRIDCVVSDYDMPGMNGLELLKAVRDDRPELPFVLLTGKGSEDVASDAISAGVTDYFQKSGDPEGLSVLAQRIQNVVGRRRAEVSYRELFEKATEGFSLHDPETGAFIDANASLVAMLGRDRDELLEMTLDDVTTVSPHYEQRPSLIEQLHRAAESGSTVFEECCRRADGEYRWMEVQFTPIEIQGRELVLGQMREITERKRYEQTLSALHASVTGLVGAERPRHVADLVVATAEDLLDADRAAVHRYDPADNHLELLSTTDGERLDAGSAIALDHDDPIARAFIEGEPLETTAVSGADSERERTLLMPIGDHGVLLIATDATHSDTESVYSAAPAQSADGSSALFDNANREYAEILASAAAAALDRIQKDHEIHSTREEIQRQTTELKRLGRINSTLRELNTTLLQAQTREEVYETTCANLSDIDGVELAWVGVADDAVLDRAAWAGTIPQYLDSVSLRLEEGNEPAVKATTTGSPVYVDNTATDLTDEPWRRKALAHGVESALAIPLEAGGITYGVLSVLGSEQLQFDDRFREMLSAIARSVSETVHSIEQRQGLSSPSATELTFEITDDEYLFQRLAADAACQIEFVGAVTESGGRCRVFVTVSSLDDESTDTPESVDSERVRDIASNTSTVESASVVSTTPDGGRLGDDWRADYPGRGVGRPHDRGRCRAGVHVPVRRRRWRDRTGSDPAGDRLRCRDRDPTAV